MHAGIPVTQVDLRAFLPLIDIENNGSCRLWLFVTLEIITHGQIDEVNAVVEFVKKYSTVH